MLCRSVLCRAPAAASAAAMATSGPFALPHVECLQRGVPDTLTWRLFLQSLPSKTLLSPWHHLPRRPTCPATSPEQTVFTYVNEIPRATRAKLEMATREPYNPIAHDFHGKLPDKPLRYFKYGDSPFNYGFLPRTWECPELTKCPSVAAPAAGRAHGGGATDGAAALAGAKAHACAKGGHEDARETFRGDGDPLDVVLLGPSCAPGSVHAVRVLGVLGLIDQGELDWKVIAEAYPMHETDQAAGFGTLAKVPAALQHTIVDWFRNYKTAEGKKQNEFIFDARIMDVDTALEVIEGCAAEYDALLAGQHANDGYWLPTH